MKKSMIIVPIECELCGKTWWGEASDAKKQPRTCMIIGEMPCEDKSKGVQQ